MDARVVEFVRGLRAAGVRVSVAEAHDALLGVRATGVADRQTVRAALRATLIKDSAAFETFDALFPMYFGSDGPPLESALDALSPDDQELVRDALEELAGRMRRLLEWLTTGVGPSKDELEALARQAGAARVRRSGEARWVTHRMLRQLGLQDLERVLADLLDQLREAGLGAAAANALLGIVDANRAALEEHIARHVGMSIQRARAEEPHPGDPDLMRTPFEALTPREMETLRREVARLAARLRSRAALRHRHAGRGRLDPKRTVRANQRYGGVPVELRFRRRKRRPRLVIICDVSTSVRPVSEFMLHLIYELQDQVAKARSFVFNTDLVEVSAEMAARRPADAIGRVLEANPPGHYATDLGRSLTTLLDTAPAAVDGRTTVIVLGDGRNNYRPSRVEHLRFLRHRARRLIWLNPESQREWGDGDSDMLDYAPHCDAVFEVCNLVQLTTAVDRLLAS